MGWELNRCGFCGEALAPDDFDGVCPGCDEKLCDDCGCMPDEPFSVESVPLVPGDSADWYDCECRCHDEVDDAPREHATAAASFAGPDALTELQRHAPTAVLTVEVDRGQVVAHVRIGSRLFTSAAIPRTGEARWQALAGCAGAEACYRAARALGLDVQPESGSTGTIPEALGGAGCVEQPREPDSKDPPGANLGHPGASGAGETEPETGEK